MLHGKKLWTTFLQWPNVASNENNCTVWNPKWMLNEGSMVQTCRNINVYVVNTDICWYLFEYLWITWESRPMNVHSISKKFLQDMTTETLRWACYFEENK